MHRSFPFQCIFSASLPTFRKGVHCTKALHPLTHAVQCAVRFSTLYVMDGRDNAWRSRAPGPHAHGNAARQVVDGLWTEVCGQQKQSNDPRNNQHNNSQLLGAANAQTAHLATSSTAPAHQPLGSADAETTPAGAPAAAADKKERPGAICKGKNR